MDQLSPPPREVRFSAAYYSFYRGTQVTTLVAASIFALIATIHLYGYGMLLIHAKTVVVKVTFADSRVSKGNEIYTGHFVFPKDPQRGDRTLEYGAADPTGDLVSVSYEAGNYDHFVEGTPSLERFKGFFGMWLGIIVFVFVLGLACLDQLIRNTRRLMRQYREWPFALAPIAKIHISGGKTTTVTVSVKVPVPAYDLRSYATGTTTLHVDEMIPVLYDPALRGKVAVPVLPGSYVEVVSGGK